MRTGFSWASALLVIQVGGCDSSNTTSGNRCVPGKTEPCACLDGSVGAQSCASDGRFGECVCPGKNGSTPYASAGAGTGFFQLGGAAGAVVPSNPSGSTGTTSADPLTLGGSSGTNVVGPASYAGTGASLTTSMAAPAAGGSGVGGSSTALPGTHASSAGQPAVGGTTNTAQTCGNGIVEGSEGCDRLPRDNDLGEGCTPNCAVEPTCPAAGGACISTCGDGFVHGLEECDDANAVNGDGCSSACQVEPGFQCTAMTPNEPILLPLVVRDFDQGGDFEHGGSFGLGLSWPTQGLLAGTLASDGQKPVLASTLGTYDGTAGEDSGIASKASFAQWYDDEASAAGNLRHATLATSLRLFRKPDGDYTNRFGNNGDGMTDATYKRYSKRFCGTPGNEDHDASGNALPCTLCPLDTEPSTPQCEDPIPTDCQTDPAFVECMNGGTQWTGLFLEASHDGNPLFFPADALSPYNPEMTAQLAGLYDATWPQVPGKHNFSFTTELRFWFRYDASMNYRLDFVGDDDVWIFVNKHLALDLGGIHMPVDGALTIDGATSKATATATSTNSSTATPITTQPDLGDLVDGEIYEVVVFHAERQTNSSSYALGLSGNFIAPRSACHRL